MLKKQDGITMIALVITIIILIIMAAMTLFLLLDEDSRQNIQNYKDTNNTQSLENKV